MNRQLANLLDTPAKVDTYTWLVREIQRTKLENAGIPLEAVYEALNEGLGSKDFKALVEIINSLK